MTLIAPDGSFAFVPDAERTMSEYLLGMGYATQTPQQWISVGGNRHEEVERNPQGAAGESGQSGAGDSVFDRGQSQSQDASGHGSVAEFNLRQDGAGRLQQPDGEQRPAPTARKGRAKPGKGNAAKRKAG